MIFALMVSHFLAGLRNLDRQVVSLAARLDEAASPDATARRDYQPTPAPKFWKLDDTTREEVIARLRAWVEHVYQPGYGHLAVSLGASGAVPVSVARNRTVARALAYAERG